MRLLSIFKQSIIALKANKLRAIFSIVGIVIGVSAVVVILSLGQGLKAYVTNQIEAFGPNMLDIAIKVPGAGEIGSMVSMVRGIKVTTLKTSDIKDMRDKTRFPYIESISGQVLGQEWISYGKNEKKTFIYGCNPDFVNVYKIAKVSKGRFFTEDEDRSLAKVAVLGNKLAEKLFEKTDPIGKKIKVKGQNFKIIGIIDIEGLSSFGGIDSADFLYIPIETALKEVMGIDYISEIVLMVKDPSYFPQAIEGISRLLRRNHNISDPDKDDFQIITMTEILEGVNDVSMILNLLLGFLATISLIVGGVGIMNIMFVSVSERTHEIGLRKALGASSKNILLQFLIESIIITCLGGFIGIVIGISMSLIGGIIARGQGLDWPLVISWLAVVAAFIVATAIGLIFGIYPAFKAAKLDPIDALRK
ncbi:ABC transporter permease [Patescibacteria group bacterium]